MKQKDLLWWITIMSIFIIIFYLLYEKCNYLENFTFQGKKQGIKILIVGGTHGNEPAGSVALHNLKKRLQKNNIKRGSLIIIPDVNHCGLKIGTRWNPGNILYPDINRSYPNSTEENGKCFISQKIKKMVDKSDFVLDLHEGYNFYNTNPKSIGSTISPGLTKFSEKISLSMKEEVNKEIKDKNKKFHIINYEEKDVIRGTLSEYCRIIGKNYILIETTGQRNIQPLNIRVKQMEIMIDVLLKELN